MVQSQMPRIQKRLPEKPGPQQNVCTTPRPPITFNTHREELKSASRSKAKARQVCTASAKSLSLDNLELILFMCRTKVVSAINWRGVNKSLHFS